MSAEDTLQRELENDLQILEQSCRRFARRGRDLEDWLHDLILEYLRACERGTPPENLWGWAEVVLRHRAARERTRSRAHISLPDELEDPSPPPAEAASELPGWRRREIWEQIRPEVLEELSESDRRALEDLPERSSMHQWANDTGRDRVNLRRIVARAAKIARKKLPPP